MSRDNLKKTPQITKEQEEDDFHYSACIYCDRNFDYVRKFVDGFFVLLFFCTLGRWMR